MGLTRLVESQAPPVLPPLVKVSGGAAATARATVIRRLILATIGAVMGLALGWP